MLEVKTKIRCNEIPSFNHERFLSKIRVNRKSGCWEWIGPIYKGTGYGNLCINYKKYLAHRISYSIFTGINNLENVVDHICRNRKCVNPDHLRLVTTLVNSLENSESPTFYNYKKTHCFRGHEFTPENTRTSYKPGIYGGRKRGCKQCSKIYEKTRVRNRRKKCLK